MADKKNNFALLHFIGACMVMYGHEFALFGVAPPTFLGNSVSTTGVKMIFVITGFLITQSYARNKKFGIFIKRRLIRIFPALIACVVLTTIAFSVISNESIFTYFRYCYNYVLHNILLYPWYALPGVFTDNIYPNAVNGSLWTMPVEVAMYFVIGLLLMMFYKTKEHKVSKAIYVSFCVAFILLEAAHDVFQFNINVKFWGTDWGAAMDLIPYMLIGSLCAIFNIKKYLNIQVAFIVLLISCCITYKYYELITFIVLPYCTLSFALSEKPFFANAFSKYNIAYSIYLYGFPIQQLIIYLLRVKSYYNGSINVFFCISIIPVIIVACISNRFIEKPVEAFLRKKLIKA